MTTILCNLPLECFDDRAAYAAAGVELVTYGPADRMWVDGTHYPFDVAFDPSTQSIEELLAAVPADRRPDFLLIYWPDQEPLPIGLERCPIPVVGVVSDYNISLHTTAGLWPFFDSLLCDARGTEVFGALPFADVRAFVQFSFKRPTHRIYPDEVRSLDVAFAGNLNPRIQADRAPYLDRLRALAWRGARVELASGVHGADYGRLLNRARIGFNRSVRGEMNLRAFEVPACGALLLMESSNGEVREFFEPGAEVVLYDDDNLEQIVLELLADEPRRAAIAAAGHARVQEHRMSRRLAALVNTLGPLTVRRQSTRARPADCAMGRARALAHTWASPNARLAALLEAQRLAPDDPRPLNDLAVTMCQIDAGTHATRAIDLFGQALERAPSYVAAATNLAWLLRRAGMAADAARFDSEIEARASRATEWTDFDGLRLPPGFTDESLGYCTALVESLRSASLAPLRDNALASSGAAALTGCGAPAQR